MNPAPFSEAWCARLRSLECELSKDLPEEPEVVARVARVIRRKCAGLCNPGRPTGCFLLVGPNAPARRLAKGLARALYGDEHRLVNLNLEDYAEKHQVSGLFGHNGGLVCDYFEGNLTEPLLQQPATIVLMENLEKAHADVWRLLRGAFEEGALVDWIGQPVPLGQAVFLLTTQVGYSPSASRAPQTIDVEGRPVSRRLPEESTAAIEREFPPDMLRGTFIDDLLMIGWEDDSDRCHQVPAR